MNTLMLKLKKSEAPMKIKKALKVICLALASLIGIISLNSIACAEDTITIGDNTVIGAGSVVTKDIPANVVAVGNPCRVLREISEHDKEFYFKDRKINLK